MGPLWGIDLGGTKIEGVIIEDAKSMNVLKRMRIPTEQDKGYIHIIRQIYKLVETMTAEVGIKPQKLGLAHPGTLDPITQLMKNSNATCLNGMPLKRDLEQFLGFEVAMANDANCFAVAEALMGDVQEVLPEAEVVFGVIMGTGVGGGLVVNGKVINGRQGIAGEWGHNFLDLSGGACYCGKVGCVERIISGSNLERYYLEQSGVKKSLKDIVKAHDAGDDPHAARTMQRLIEYFGKGMASIINILDPDAIVLGGGVSNIDLLYTEGVQEVAQHIFNPQLNTLFLKPRLGDSAGVFGAALLTKE